LLLVLATASNSDRIIFHRGAYSSGMRAAENFSVSVPLSAVAIRDAIAGIRFVAWITQNRLQILSSRASATIAYLSLVATRIASCEIATTLRRSSLHMSTLWLCFATRSQRPGFRPRF